MTIQLNTINKSMSKFDTEKAPSWSKRCHAAPPQEDLQINKITYWNKRRIKKLEGDILVREISYVRKHASGAFGPGAD